jgi:hypothetical protein
MLNIQRTVQPPYSKRQVVPEHITTTYECGEVQLLNHRIRWVSEIGFTPFIHLLVGEGTPAPELVWTL